MRDPLNKIKKIQTNRQNHNSHLIKLYKANKVITKIWILNNQNINIVLQVQNVCYKCWSKEMPISCLFTWRTWLRVQEILLFRWINTNNQQNKARLKALRPLRMSKQLRQVNSQQNRKLNRNLRLRKVLITFLSHQADTH